MCLFCFTKSQENAEDDIELLREEPPSPKNPLIPEKGAQIVFMGDPGCGKSSIIRRIANEKYEDFYLATLGIEIKTAWIKLEGPPFKVLMYDATGRLQFDTHTISLLQYTDCFVFVFDLSQPLRKSHVLKWIEDVNSHLEPRNPPARYILIGNKVDSPNRCVNAADLETILDSVELYMETSAKTGQNMERLLMFMGGLEALK